MTDLPSLRHLRLLAALGRSGSITRAAEALGMSQPAASQAVSALEERFGGGLFEKRPARLEPTPRGGIVLGRVQRGLAVIDAAGPSPGLLGRRATIAGLRALAAFDGSGGFTAAARLLGLSEPSVHRAARTLETALGVGLFEAGGGGTILTRAGSMLATHASLALHEFERAFDELREADGLFDGTIAFGTLPLARTRIVPDAVVALSNRYPEATIDIHDGAYDALAAALAAGRIHLLVGALRDPPPRGLDQRPLFRDGLTILARSGHPLSARSTLTSADFAPYPWVVPREGTPGRRILDQAVAAQEIDFRRAGLVQTGSTAVARGILLRSDYLTAVSRAQFSYEEDAGLLAALPFRLEGTDRAIGIATRAGWRPTALEHAFVEALEAAARDEAVPD